MTITLFAVYKDLSESVYFLQKKKGDIKTAIHLFDNDKQKEMRENKAVYVNKHKIRDDHNLIYQMHKSERNSPNLYDMLNASCQFDSKKENAICTCKNVSVKKAYELKYLNSIPKQAYAYHGSRSYTDIGVGSVKTLQRRKVKRVYLPETDEIGVGSSDLSTQASRRLRQLRSSYYEYKRTSSKCVGGILDYNGGSVINEKLSPIIQSISCSTSPKISFGHNNIEIGSNTVDRTLKAVGIQFDSDAVDDQKENTDAVIKDDKIDIQVTIVKDQKQNCKTTECVEGTTQKELVKKGKETERVYSSDSLVQHIHNLDNPSDYKQSRTSFPDPMENKLEREYRKLFSIKSRESKSSYEKPMPENKSASILRRRFEALRRGLAKKGDSNAMKIGTLTKSSTLESFPSHKDASVTSDPPSLIARSFSNTKTFSPQQNSKKYNSRGDGENDDAYRNERYSNQYQSNTDSDSQGVKGMFKLWGKKFNFEEDVYKKQATPMSSCSSPKKIEKEVKPKTEPAPKKEGRKFFFFKKKSKDKNKEAYKSKKDVTAGRCEIRDGLTLKIGSTTSRKNSNKESISRISEEGDDISRKTWLKKFLSHSIESARSVNVRWNNSLYATSSSTVFELLDTVYKNTGVDLRSRSETTTEGSFYKSYTKHKVNFVQDIEAWMIPQIIPDRPKELPFIIKSNKDVKASNIEVTISGQKWLIDKSEAFAHKIEVVLNSSNRNVTKNKVSSEYLTISIPKDFFNSAISDTSKRNQSSDEEVYNIVEYETNSETKRAGINIDDLEKGDHVPSDIKVIVNVQDSENMESKNIFETVIKRPPMHRDVVLQGSNVNIPRRCDVIGVGIITQTDMREIGKPLFKVQDVFLSDDESSHLLKKNQKKCEFAESYLQEYYRHWTPLGLDLYSWCVSDNRLRSCSERSMVSFQNQGDGTKSCPNIYDDFQAATAMSSCGTSSCNVARAIKDSKGKLRTSMTFSSNFFKTCKKDVSKTETSKNFNGNGKEDFDGKRVLPKDSVEVTKKRKAYAVSNKNRWCCPSGNPVSSPSIESKAAQHSTMTECPKRGRIIYTPKAKKASCNKHVSLPDCETMDEIVAKQFRTPEGILAFKGISCDACKKGAQCPKHISLEPDPECIIPQPPCKTSCEQMKNPPCDKPKSPSCNVSPQRSCEAPACPNKPVPKFCPPCKQPVCYPETPTCRTPPCPASLPVCPRYESLKSNLKSTPCPSPPRSPPPCKKPSPCEIPTPPPCKKPSPCKGSCIPTHRKPSRCDKPSPCEKPSPPPCRKPSPCTKPSPTRTPSPPPCRKPSPSNKHSFCREPSPPPCKKHSSCKGPSPPPCKSSPYKKQSPCRMPSPPPCQRPPSPPPCKKPPSALRKKHPSSRSPPPCPPLAPCPTRADSIPPCSPPPCPQATHRCSPSPCKKQIPCKKRFKKPPCQKCPTECCYSRSSCELLPAISPILSNESVPKLKRRRKSSSSHSSRSSFPGRSPGASPGCSPPISQKCSSSSLLRKDIRRVSGEFPWPMDSQISYQPSLHGSLRDYPAPLCQSVAQVGEKQCRPDCANRRSAHSPPRTCSPPAKSSPPPRCPPPPTCPDSPPYSGKSKVSGIFLKMKPSSKKSVDECLAWYDEQEQNTLRLNSNDRLTIKLRKQSPSTDEIREGMNIKVQDEDGRTVFERKDYTCENYKPSVLGDVCNSNVNRVATVTNLASIPDDNEMSVCKSEHSLANLIEIQFKLRITQGDKTAEINIADENDTKQDIANSDGKTEPEVYILKNEAEEAPDDTNNKNNISIKIIVKNFKQKPQKYQEGKHCDDFSKKISNKFHTVSTGYSDIARDQNEDQVYSVHRATINLSSSVDKSKTLSNLAVSKTDNAPTNAVSLPSVEQLPTDITENDEKLMSSKKPSRSEMLEDTIKSELPDFNDTDDQDTAHTLGGNTSNECNIEDEASSRAEDTMPELVNDIRRNNRDDKKLLLKKLIRKAYDTKDKTKGKVRQMREMLKIVLTDSSDNEQDMNTRNELAKDVTYASLEPKYLKDSDSMNNYYHIDSTFSSLIAKGKTIYPTLENNSEVSRTSESEANDITFQGCMCSKVAEKLNQCKQNLGCCCRKKVRSDAETNCDLRNEEDLLLYNFKTDYIDVQTQHSRYLTSKCNSLNVSLHSSRVENVELGERNTSGTNVTKKVTKTFLHTTSSHKDYIKKTDINTLNVNTAYGSTDDERIVMTSETSTKASTRVIAQHASKPNTEAADILQSYETKKAVLQIYAEETENGDHYVAKLPKFVYDKESEITRNYEEIATNSYKSVCKENVVMISIVQ